MNVDYSDYPLTPDEKNALRRNSRSALRWHIAQAFIWGFFLISSLSFVILFALWQWLALVDNPQTYKMNFIYLSLFIGFITIFKMGWLDLLQFFKGIGKTDPKLQDFKYGMARVITLCVKRAVEIKEFEDEGTGFFLEMEDGRVLSVIGQDLYDYSYESIEQPEEFIMDKRHLFPQTKIELRFAPSSGMRFDVRGVGETLRPYAYVKTTRKQFKKDKFTGVMTYVGPEDGVFYDGTMEDVLQKFQYKPQLL